MSAVSIEVNIQNDSDTRLEFELNNVDLSVVNGLRRVILTEIDSLVIRGFPHKENLIHIKTNKTKYNNEYLKHRLSCIPLLVSNRSSFEKFKNDYVLKIDVKNETTDKMTLTTNDIKLFNKDKLVSFKEGSKQKSLFYEDPIPICYLYPKISENDPCEEFVAEIKLSVGNAKEDACWNMVSKCLFFNTEDPEEVEKRLEQIPEEGKMDFKLLNAQRYFVPNHYTFVVESVGVYTNKEIVRHACTRILETIHTFMEELASMLIKQFVPNIPVEGLFHIYEKVIGENDKMYIIQLEKDDYTYGKLIEKYLFNHNNGLFKFVAFKKEHPHDKHSLVQIVFTEYDKDSDDVLKNILRDIFVLITTDFNKIKEDFN